MSIIKYDSSQDIISCMIKAVSVSWLYYLSVTFGFLSIGCLTNDIFRSVITGFILFIWAHRTHIWAHNIWPCTWFHGWHHDPENSHTTWGLFIETFTNLIGSGGLSLILYNISFEMFTGFKILNNYTILYFSLLYTTFHMINYHYLNVKTHKDHHEDISYNFGPDVIDVMFQTKKDHEEYEDMNHAIVNNIGILLIVVLLYGSRLDPISFLRRLILTVIKNRE